ncbi:response regulator transcription factor [Effusibacillus lacus]|uniref:DNA-binding response regulator n=1 Tax=Effusibacillus lacus TaxID=1348429 RepID=A0A292YT11_9BACL|nr:response regulator transcription factor [Effusibacillus lacus]TCS74950.1 DNA-binding response OmpR family regulator [Effusibacillus lacus]GAX91620.1 DNA-binding response regulator [Effusibacillus lacus]
MKTILIVEDELVISRVLKVYLQKANFNVEQAFTGQEAIEKFDFIKPSLVVLDVMLPDLDGWSILKYIRERSSCPVIMLTALGEIDQKLSGLNQGADDYMTKPFIADEVVARVNAVLRRSAQIIESNETIYYGSLKIDFKGHSVSLNGIELNFTPRDLSLFLFLAQHPNQTFTREQLIEHIWGYDYEGSDRAVDLAIKRIRKMLKNWPSSEGEIKTLRGLGYQFCVSEKR